ncbi:hypothetical protein Pla108_07430 [Botrimarina colliarenosi]|uniref:Uncharacterized protein n=1 Tax=Botrimarina colliarenosi TaxID=2528001 RepID=A0A5C6AK58_9BACT|nr:hypothetical protein [Botrimarina colliarenosi]TWT99800.1 hypothetical protein Pla108_07430 [Botrimarina colliarenosi]
MHRTFIALACSLGMVAIAEAQTGIGSRPQTAMSALGQTNVLSHRAGSGYRTAARNGVGSATGRPAAMGGKPFAAASTGPTISPYLNLFRTDSSSAAPNYYTFVRPMQDQYEANRLQQAQMQTLQRQVQQATYLSPATSVAGGARYGETGHYYGGWRR